MFFIKVILLDNSADGKLVYSNRSAATGSRREPDAGTYAASTVEASTTMAASMVLTSLGLSPKSIDATTE